MFVRASVLVTESEWGDVLRVKVKQAKVTDVFKAQEVESVFSLMDVCMWHLFTALDQSEIWDKHGLTFEVIQNVGHCLSIWDTWAPHLGASCKQKITCRLKTYAQPDGCRCLWRNPPRSPQDERKRVDFLTGRPDDNQRDSSLEWKERPPGKAAPVGLGWKGGPPLPHVMVQNEVSGLQMFINVSPSWYLQRLLPVQQAPVSAGGEIQSFGTISKCIFKILSKECRENHCAFQA